MTIKSICERYGVTQIKLHAMSRRELLILLRELKELRDISR